MTSTQRTLASLVSEAVGPLPCVCAEHVLQDLERTRMMAEDFREGNAVCDIPGEIGAYRNIVGTTWRQRVTDQRLHLARYRAHTRELERREDALLDEADEAERLQREMEDRLDERENKLTNIIAIVRAADGGTAQEQADALAQIRRELGMDNMDVNQE